MSGDYEFNPKFVPKGPRKKLSNGGQQGRNFAQTNLNGTPYAERDDAECVPVAGTDGNIFAQITCYHCKNKSDKCPSSNLSCKHHFWC